MAVETHVLAFRGFTILPFPTTSSHYRFHVDDGNANINCRSGYFDIPLIYIHYLDICLMGLNVVKIKL